MKVFVVHRNSARGIAKKHIRKLGMELGILISPVFLSKSSGESWKAKALKEIQSSEVVFTFDPEACSGSENTLWELEQARRLGKKIIEVWAVDDVLDAKREIRNSYELQDEFNECFSSDAEHIDHQMELYKLMVETSEQLILRRLRINAFFITIIGSLSAVIGLLIKEGFASQDNIWVLLLLTVPGLILCNSWRNQIDNYGKLNAGKFSVILKMEKNFPTQIFSAEWISLGKGMRPKKYRSFTATEMHVPLLFGVIFLLFSLGIIFMIFQHSSFCVWFSCGPIWGLSLDTFGCCP